MTDAPGATRIASVAHLFLSELRKEAGVAPGPKRIKPTDDSPPPPQQADRSERTDPPLLLSRQPISEPISANSPADRTPRPQILMALASHLHWDGAKGLTQFARRLAGQGKTVVVVKLETTAVDLRLFYHKDKDKDKDLAGKFSPMIVDYDEDRAYSEDPKGPPVPTSGSGKVDPDRVWQILAGATGQIDYLLLTCGPGYDQAVRERLFARADQICIVVHPKSDHLISSYQLIKSLVSQGVSVPLGVFVTQAAGQSEAQEIFQRLNRTVREFADAELLDLGFTPADQNVAQELLSRTDLGTRTGNTRQDVIAGLERYLDQIGASERGGDGLNDGPSGPAEQEHVCPPSQSNTATSSTGIESGDGGPALLTIDLGSAAAEQAEPIGDKFMESLIGRLLGDGQVFKDGLCRFLTNCGLDCGKARSGDVETMVILIGDDMDRQVATWALGNYPKGREKLIIVAAVPIDMHLQRSWARQFAEVSILQAVRGNLNGISTLIVQPKQ